jgi:hypothetical protein
MKGVDSLGLVHEAILESVFLLTYYILYSALFKPMD